jgi:flagellar protein FliO/FliZ
MNAWRATGMALLALPELALATGEQATRAGAFALGDGLGLQLTLGLAVVLAAAVGLSWLLRRHALPRGGAIQVLGGLPLGARERLLLVEVEQVRLLIGVTATQIQALHVFPPPSAPPASFQRTLDASSSELPHERPKS